MNEDQLSLNALADRISDLRNQASTHARALSHLHFELRQLESEMFKRQAPAEDWE